MCPNKERLFTMRLFILLLASLLTTHCSYGAYGTTTKLPDKTLLHYEEFTTRGEGVQLKTVDSFRCTKEYQDSPLICSPFQHTAASGNSLTVALFNGAGTAILGTATAALPAHYLRPSEENTTVGNAGNTVNSGSVNAESKSESTGGTGTGGNAVSTPVVPVSVSSTLSNSNSTTTQQSVTTKASKRKHHMKPPPPMPMPSTD
jgi:hypothetical protein